MDRSFANTILSNMAEFTTATDPGQAFASVVSKLASLPPLSDLKDPIHPICKASNWDSRIDHSILHLGLQLASKLLLTSKSLSFFHTIIFGKTQREKYILCPPAQDKKHFEFTDHPDSLKPDQERMAEAQLTEFADRVSFVVVTAATGPAERWVMSTHSDEGDEIFEIRLEQIAIEELESAAAEYVNTGAAKRYQLGSFLLARTICHEIAHVVYSHFWTDICYFPGSSICEPGYSWEEQVFSGLIDEDRFGEFDAYIRPWPNSRSTHAMLVDEQDIGVRLKHSASFLPTLSHDGRRTLVNSVVARGADSSYFARLFSERFWTEELVEQSPSALYPSAREETYYVVGKKIMETLRMLYSKAKPALEEEGKNCRTAEEREELSRLCEPWENFMRDSVPRR